MVSQQLKVVKDALGMAVCHHIAPVQVCDRCSVAPSQLQRQGSGPQAVVCVFRHDEPVVHWPLAPARQSQGTLSKRCEVHCVAVYSRRAVSMANPDVGLIIETILFSQGFMDASSLARKIAVFFKLASEQLSLQKHYDFGLRAMKVRACDADIRCTCTHRRVWPSPGDCDQARPGRRSGFWCKCCWRTQCRS